MSDAPREDGGGGEATQAAAQRRKGLESGAIVGGRYRIDKLLARGGMAAVYRATQEGLDRTVALKVMSVPPNHVEADGTLDQRFRLEAKALASLSHPNIVVIYDYGETEDGGFYLAMEYIDGPSVTQLLKQGPLGVERALRMMRDVAAALEHAHGRGIAHRDIKASNVMCQSSDSGKESFKVVDFGLVKLLEQDAQLTSTGVVMGSPHFMSPEQAQGQDVDHRADIYASGVLLFCAITGQFPYTGNTASIIVGHCTEPVPKLNAVAPELAVPRDVEQLIRDCMEKKPGKRPADMGAVLQRVDALLASPGADAATGSRAVTPAKDTTFRDIGLAVGAVLITAAGAATVYALMKGEPEAPPPEPAIAIQNAPAPEPAPEKTVEEAPAPQESPAPEEAPPNTIVEPVKIQLDTKIEVAPPPKAKPKPKTRRKARSKPKRPAPPKTQPEKKAPVLPEKGLRDPWAE